MSDTKGWFWKGTLLLRPLLQLVFAFRFLTIIPLPATDGLLEELSERDRADSSVYFPLVGLLKGVFFYLIYSLAGAVLPLQVSALFVLVASILITGGFHLDGLADTVDALASRKPVKDKLTIMKDSTIGAIGVVAIAVVVLSRYVLLVELIRRAPLGLMLFPVIGSVAMVVAMSVGRSARSDGLGRLFIEGAGRKRLLSVTGLLVVIIFLFAILSYLSFIGLILPVAMVYLFVMYANRLFGKHFNGLTGDNLGFISEVSEIVFMAGLIPFLG